MRLKPVTSDEFGEDLRSVADQADQSETWTAPTGVNRSLSFVARAQQGPNVA
jgi:hypothetical protein